MAALTAAGGAFGYYRARSIPSLAGGLLVSAMYGRGGYLTSQNRVEGLGYSLAASTVLVAASIRRAVKFAAVPAIGLSTLGLLTGGFYANKIYREQVGY